MNLSLRFSLGIILAFVAAFSGCGENTGVVGYVSGKVVVPDGKNSEGLLVRFTNGATGVGATAIVNENGTYELKHKGNAGVPIGNYKISVTAYVPQMSDKEFTEFMSSPPAKRKEIESQRNAKMTLVPEQYHRAATSELSYEIVSGTQEHNIVLTN